MVCGAVVQRPSSSLHTRILDLLGSWSRALAWASWWVYWLTCSCLAMFFGISPCYENLHRRTTNNRREKHFSWHLLQGGRDLRSLIKAGVDQLLKKFKGLKWRKKIIPKSGSKVGLTSCPLANAISCFHSVSQFLSLLPFCWKTFLSREGQVHSIAWCISLC